MTEEEIFKWFEAHPKVLKTFDIDKDGVYSYQEIRWAVKTAIKWAQHAQDNEDNTCWFYVKSKRAHGPVDWFQLEKLKSHTSRLYIKLEETSYWLPFEIISKIKIEGIEEKKNDHSGPRTSTDQAPPSDYPTAEISESNGVHDRESELYFKQKQAEIWSDKLYIVEDASFLRGYFSGNIYTSKKKLLLKVKPDVHSAPGLNYLFRNTDRMNWGWNTRHNYNRLIARQISLETPLGNQLYHLERKFFGYFLPVGVDVYDMTNPELGKLHCAHISYFSLGFKSWGKINRSRPELPIYVGGPFWDLRFTLGGKMVARMNRSIPKTLDWIVNPRNIYIIKILDKRISPHLIIAYLLSKKPRFWRLNLRHRAS